jgi:hypothetical protein
MAWLTLSRSAKAAVIALMTAAPAANIAVPAYPAPNHAVLITRAPVDGHPADDPYDPNDPNNPFNPNSPFNFNNPSNPGCLCNPSNPFNPSNPDNPAYQ